MGDEKRDKLSDKDIALYALHLLTGWQKRVHTEDVALKCYELAPSKFSWVKYPQYPDPAPTRFALESAKKPRHGVLVRGESERKRSGASIGGWTLTAEGIEWIKSNKPRIEQYLGEHLPTGDRLPADRKLRGLLDSGAFKKFSTYGDEAEISRAEFAESLVCTVNTGPDVLNDRLELLDSIGEQLSKKEVKKYVSFCRTKFAPILEAKGGGSDAKV